MSAWGDWGERGDNPWDFFCLLSAQQSQAASAERRAGCIPRHLVLQINISGGTQTGKPPLPGSPAPCPLGRLPGAEAAVAAAEVRPRCWLMARPAALSAAGSTPGLIWSSGGGCPLRPIPRQRPRRQLQEQRSASRSDRRCAPRPCPERAPGSLRNGAEAALVAGTQRLAHR